MQFDDINTEDDDEARKNQKRIHVDTEDAGGAVVPESDFKRTKRIMRCLTEPSYTLGLGHGKLRCEHRRRLVFLLRKLVRQHNWIEASGVLSVVLKATCKDRSPETNRMKYSVLMEVLEHVESGHMNPNTIKHIYDVWMRRIGSSKKSSSKDRLMVHLEFILFCLTQGNVEDAHQAALSITQEPEFGKHFMSNMLLGLTFYQLWYNSIPKEMQLAEPEQLHTSSPSRSLRDSFNTPGGNTHGDGAVYSYEDNTMAHYDSDTSVMKDKQISVDSHADGHPEIFPKIETHTEEGELHQNIQSQGFYIHSADNESLSGDARDMHDAGEKHGASFFPYLDGLDSWLLPIKLPQNMENHLYLVQLQRKVLNDYYKDAIKYFRLTLESSPQSSDALLPLIQLLLIGGQIDEAVRMLENFCLNANTAFPFRLLATLLERFDRKNHAMLSSCYENILKIDPTCSHAVARLIYLHQRGYYTAVSLVEMIALHLDATFAESNAWGELAACFLKLSQCEEDRMSVRVNGSEGGLRQRFSVCFNRVPKLFSEEGWRFRSRLWQSLHFSPGILKSEISAGDLQLLTCKAACAAHMYHPGFEYIVKVYDSLVKENDCEMLSFLQLHMQNSIGLHFIHQP